MIAERSRDVPLGMPSPEALNVATDFISRRYVLSETMDHPQVRSECLRLAYMIQAYGLAVSSHSGMEVASRLPTPRRVPPRLFDAAAPHVAAVVLLRDAAA